MKIQVAKQLLTAVLASIVLVACGGDKPQESTAKKSESTSTSQPAPQTANPPKESQDNAETKTTQPSTTPSPEFETVVKAAAALPADAGEQRYEKSCKVCHDTGMLDSPKLSDKANWQNRLTKGKETLFNHSAKGFNKMPAQATGDVSEAEVYAAIEYILSKVNE